MTAKQLSLCERLKQVGFTQGNQMKLYGQEFELLGEPIVMGDNLVLVDAIEKKSGQLRRVRIPLTTVNMANGERSGHMSSGINFRRILITSETVA